MIDLNRRNNLNYDDKLFEIIIDGMMIEKNKTILPITEIVLEVGQFDTHLMQNFTLANPKVKHWGYQKGPNYGFANTKARVLNRDNYQCQYCKTKKNGTKLEVHHIKNKNRNKKGVTEHV